MTTGFTAQNQPDILEVIANLSNDEVFTPPRIANAVLDLLPPEVWVNPDLRWLDPGCKTGIFPREITKRLMVGLVEAFPDDKSRLEHILKNMVFAIAITELTSLMVRRTLYCSKDASGERSSVRMPSSDGNIWMNRVEHSYRGGRCSECGAAREQMERENRENYAYGFIHTNGREAIEKEMHMKFDVIVGNPPYQMDGGGGGTNATPLYDVFVQQAIGMNPKYLTMIVPSRWMAGGRGLDSFREQMLNDTHIRKLVDYPNAEEVFPVIGKSIKGGVCYFLWERDNPGKCEVTLKRGGATVGPIARELNQFDIFIRDARAIEILNKVMKKKERTLEEIVSGDTPFGLASNYGPLREGTKEVGEIKLYAVKSGRRLEAWIPRDAITKNVGLIDAWKVLVPKAGSDGGAKLPDVVLGKPLIAAPKSVCTQTFMTVGPVENREEAENLSNYLTSRFARFLISLRKISQDALRSTYSWVPLQDFSKPITDAELFKKYGITKDEQAYISEMIKEMP
jgi:site-specific DNA-methyltransferase (adenine-specific)